VRSLKSCADSSILWEFLNPVKILNSCVESQVLCGF
jgi:hypothetical protein